MKIVAVVLALAAGLVTYWTYRTSFTPAHWAGYNDVGDIHNPRLPMVQDLLDHHLRPGMPRDSVLRLLGPPESEGLQRRLSHGPWPESLWARARHMPLDSLNRLITASPLDTILSYPIGWSIIDPMSLYIRLDRRGHVVSARVVEH